MGHLLKCCHFGPAAPIIKQVRNSSSWLQKSSWRSYLNFANRSAWNPSPWIQARQKNIEKGRIENSFEQVIRPCPQIQLTLILVCGSLSLSYFLFLLCSNSWQSSLFWTSIWISLKTRSTLLILLGSHLTKTWLEQNTGATIIRIYFPQDCTKIKDIEEEKNFGSTGSVV